MIDANATVEWTPSHFGKRMEDWLRNMGDWCISRKRYWGLPLPFWFCPDGHMNVVASREELRERATAGLEGLQELHRPWIDPVTIDCAECGAEAVRVPEVGDCWLDAGIVPFSTLGYGRDSYEPEGFAAGAGVGLTKADLPDHAYWEKWFPADWISEMREQIRLWFYSQLFMSVALVGRAPYQRVLGYEKLHDEHGRAMHKSWGNAIWFDDAIEKIGADVSRWMFAGQDTGQNMNFGYGPASDVARRLLTLWNTYRFLVLNANPEGFRPLWEEADRGPESDNPLDRWVIARASELARDCRAALDAYDTPSMTRAVEAFWDDLSNWYVRRSRPRFWEGDRAAFATLHHALVQCLRIMGPVTPFLTDEMWQNLVARGCGPDAPVLGAPGRLSRARRGAHRRRAARRRWPTCAPSASSGTARAPRPSCACASRWPRRSWPAADPARLEALRSSGLLAEIASELNVKTVTTTTDLESLVEQQVVPNFRELGPRLGREGAGGARRARRRATTSSATTVSCSVAGEQLDPGEYELRSHAREGFEAQTDGTLVVAIDTRVTDELALEGTARDVVRFLQNVRKELGFDVSDRIAVRYAADERGSAVLAAHGDVDRARGARGALRAGRRRRSPVRGGRRRDRVRGRARVSARGARRGLRLRRAADRLRGALGGRRAARRRGSTGASGRKSCASAWSAARATTPRAHIAEWVGLPETAARAASCVEVYDSYLAVIDELGRRAHAGRAQPRGGARRAACRWRWRPTRASTSCARRSRRAGCRPVFEHVFTPDRRSAGRSPRPTSTWPPAMRSECAAPRPSRSRTRRRGSPRRARRACIVIAVPSDGVHEVEADLVLGSLLDLDLAVLGL